VIEVVFGIPESVAAALTEPAVALGDGSDGRRREFGQGGIMTGRVTGKDSLEVLLDFAGSAMARSSTVNEPQPPKI
jgi:hypothetical protein